MTLNTYLGQKGYTIPKNELTIEQQKKIRTDLTIKPYTHGGIGAGDQKTFPAYRESGNKFYVPHYYGVENFGKPVQYKVTEGTNIDLDFAGILRDYQEPVVNKFLKHCTENEYGGGLLELPCEWGKTSGSLYILSKIKKMDVFFLNDMEKCISHEISDLVGWILFTWAQTMLHCLAVCAK